MVTLFGCPLPPGRADEHHRGVALCSSDWPQNVSLIPGAQRWRLRLSTSIEWQDVMDAMHIRSGFCLV